MKYFFYIFIFLFPLSRLSAQQELISSSGAYFSGSSLQIECSVGEIMIETFSSENYVLTQGFHQVYNSRALDSLLTVLVYPNPFSSEVHVFFDNSTKGYTLNILSLSGKTMYIRQISGNEETIDLSHLPSGVYILRIMKQKTIVYISKLIKI